MHSGSRGLRFGLVTLVGVLGASLLGMLAPTSTAAAREWKYCGGDPTKTFMSVFSKGLPCSSAWILGEEALDAWDGFKPFVKVRGYKCKMYSGYPNHAGVGGTCKKGTKGARFGTGD